MTNSIPDETNPNTTQQCQQQQQSQSPHSDPKSPQTQTLTLTLPDPQSPNPNQHQYSFMPDPITTLTVDDVEPDVPSPAAYGGGGGLTRHTSKRKKHGPKRPAQERKFCEKLQILVETLKPIPFTPEKTLDFEKHQSLLQRLGLWDFVHLEFDLPLRNPSILNSNPWNLSRQTLESLNHCETTILARDFTAGARIDEQRDVALAELCASPPSDHPDLSDALKSLTRRLRAHKVHLRSAERFPKHS